MDDLLPHYERELALLRSQAGDFAKRFPKIAGRLMLSGDVGEDPHIERLIESFALLAARVHKRLDDDFPLLTESFLESLYPHYLRPFPSCSIAKIELGSAGGQLTQTSTTPAGTILQSRPVKGVACKFETSYDVELAPIKIKSLEYKGAVQVPTGTLWPKSAMSMLSLELELMSSNVKWSTLDLKKLRLYLDGESSQVSCLRDTLIDRVESIFVQNTQYGPWLECHGIKIQPVGFENNEAILPDEGRSLSAYRLLTEYFAFPEKFNFVDIPLNEVIRASGGSSITLHFAISGSRTNNDEGRLLETVSEKNIALGCTPVINLFSQRADPIRVTHESMAYPLLPDSRRAYAFEVHSIEKVWRLQKTPQGETISEFKPFYSLQHDQLLSEGEDAGRYWYIHRDETTAQRSPGYETELSIVDINFNPAAPQTDTLSIQVKATNRDLPTYLSIGNIGGDLFSEGGTGTREIKLLRKPTQPYRFERNKGSLWRLISHLSLNHLSLESGGLDALKEMLRLYNLPRNAVNARQIEGIRKIDYAPTSAWMSGEPFPGFVRGIEVRLTVDERHYAGSGLGLFVRLLDHFFGMYVHINSFSRLRVYSERNQEELYACPERSGATPLL